VLVQRTIRSDGSSERSLQIYCPDRGESVPLEQCWRCTACVKVLTDEKGDAKAVECLPAPASENNIRSVGTALRRGVTVVDLAVSLGEVVALLAEKRTGVVAVADEANRIAGVIHESTVLPELLAAQKMKSGRDDVAHLALSRADETMVPSVPVLETKPLREALLDMASSHSRCLIVVSGQGVPLGVLWDVDALHALFGTANV